MPEAPSRRPPSPAVDLRRWTAEAVFAALALWQAWPLWAVEIPPIQDLPQHLAAIRVLHDHGDPALGFARYFDVELGRTQYLAYYLAADLLAWPLGVERANRVLLTAAIVGTPYALRALLRAVGRSGWLALLALPLTWNAHLVLGFLNFVAAIPLAFAALAVAARDRRAEAPSWRRGAALAGLLVLAFYTHVVPFAFAALGTALLAVEGRGLLARDAAARGAAWRDTGRRLAPLAPAAVAGAVWTFTSPAGRATASASSLLGGGDGGPRPVFTPVDRALAELPGWLTDVLHGHGDERLLVAWGLLVLVTVVLGGAERDADPLADDLARRVGLLAPLAGLLYFVAPTSYDWIWPIHARFPLLAALLVVPALRAPRAPALRAALFAAVALVGVLSAARVERAFVAFERDEVGDLDGALAAIPEGQRTAALVFDRGSRHVKFSPFLHAAGWVQARRGGAVMFSFADFPQSPFRFREADRPPRVPPRWEWTPERVDPRTDLAWFDWVLVRGDARRLSRADDVWARVFDGERWSVWRRRGR